MLCKNKVMDSSSQGAFVTFLKKQECIVDLHKAGDSSFFYNFKYFSIQNGSLKQNCFTEVGYPWPFHIMFPGSEILVKIFKCMRIGHIMCLCRSNICVIGTEFSPVKLLEVRLCPYSSLQMAVRLFEWPARGERSYLQSMQNTHPWSFPNLGWIRPWATCSIFRRDSALNRGLSEMISTSIFQPALLHDSLLLCICDKAKTGNLVLLVQQDF